MANVFIGGIGSARINGTKSSRLWKQFYRDSKGTMRDEKGLRRYERRYHAYIFQNPLTQGILKKAKNENDFYKSMRKHFPI